MNASSNVSYEARNPESKKKETKCSALDEYCCLQHEPKLHLERGGENGGKGEQNASQNPHFKQHPVAPAAPSLQPTMAHHESEDHSYHPQDALSVAMKATVLTGGLGFLGSTVQNTLARQNIGPWGVFWRSGSTITVLGMGIRYKFQCGGQC